MRSIWISMVVITVVYLVHHGEASTTEKTLLDQAGDYDGVGASYILKTHLNGTYRPVCWEEENLERFRYLGKSASKWCEPYYMTHGSPEKGIDHPGEVSLELDCEEDSTNPGDCKVLNSELMDCEFHVRIHCMGPKTRLEKDYDYYGGADSETYYLKTYLDGSYRLVCWEEENWARFEYWEQIASKWCEPFFMTSGRPYTGTDHPGEVSLEMECVGDSTDLDDCDVLKSELKDCDYHVRISCQEPISDFDRAQPLSGILLGVCIALGVVLVISWIGFGCVCCCKKSGIRA